MITLVLLLRVVSDIQYNVTKLYIFTYKLNT